MSKNASYAVIAPGTHNPRIRYWLRNTTDNPKGSIDGTVTKYVTLTFVPGSIHDITANLKHQRLWRYKLLSLGCKEELLGWT